jgi:hypothetical protein
MTRPVPEDVERLRRAFSSVAETGTADEHALNADRIWQAARGELLPREIEEMADQASRSPETAAAWRLAVELSREIDEGRDDVVVRIGTRRPVRWALGLAAAAVVVIGIGLPIYRSFAPQPPPTLRAAEGFEITSELSADHSLPRDAFELRWTSAGEGALYDIVITDSDLGVLDRASFLEEPRYVVPAAALGELPSGAEVWWKIDATGAEGSRVSSPTFVQIVQ